MTQVLNLVLFGHLKHLDKILNKHLMKNKFKKIKSISLMFPVYRDKLTVQRMISKSIKILKKTFYNGSFSIKMKSLISIFVIIVIKLIK